jgi:hypothetical protein
VIFFCGVAHFVLPVRLLTCFLRATTLSTRQHGPSCANPLCEHAPSLLPATVRAIATFPGAVLYAYSNVRGSAIVWGNPTSAQERAVNWEAE